MRISTPGFTFNNYCTLSDVGACPNNGKFTVNSQSSNKMIRLLTPKPQMKHIDRSSSVIVAKYQKLCRHSKRIFRSNKATSMLRTVSATKSNSWFLRRHRRFATFEHANWITLPYHRPLLASNRPTKPSKVDNLPFTWLRRYFSLRL